MSFRNRQPNGVTDAHDLYWGELASAFDPSGGTTPPTLMEYVQHTYGNPLHRWQEDFCKVCEYATEPLRDLAARNQHGMNRRVAIHAPPRVGKSIILSQRLPAWLLGIDPTLRIGIACYAIDKAGEFTATVRQCMRSQYHRDAFPNPSGWLREPAGALEFTTHARHAIADGQDAMTAISMTSGYTGKGFDLIIFDDPFKSMRDAESEVILRQTIKTFESDIMARLPAGVMMMVYHRYHADDLASVAIMRYGFENYRFAARSDGEDDDPTNKWEGREIGDPLSPLLPAEYLDEVQARTPDVYRAMFMGKPGRPAGVLINPVWFDDTMVKAPPIKQWYRIYDFALEAHAGADYTASCLCGKDDHGNFCIIEMTEDRIDAADHIAFMHWNALNDPPGTVIVIEDTVITAHLKRQIAEPDCILNPWIVTWVKIDKQESKVTRSAGLRAGAKYGRVRCRPSRVRHYPRGFVENDEGEVQYFDWFPLWLRRCQKFDGREGGVDDMVDAASFGWMTAMNETGGEQLEPALPVLPGTTEADRMALGIE